MIVHELQEHQPCAVPELVARRVLAQHARLFDITAPSALDGPDWRVRSNGLVGFLPLDRELALRIAPKVEIRSLLAMLELAYDLPSLAWHQGLVAQDTVDGLFETLVLVLTRRVSDRLRKGLYRAYVGERDGLQAVRGRVLPRESIVRAARGGVALVCDYEELTENLLDNQILLWTLERVRRSPLARLDVAREVRATHRLLASAIDMVPVRTQDCVGRVYHQLNADYRVMHALSRVLLEATGAATEAGATETVPFTVDMPRLFERFVARWLVGQLPSVGVDEHHRFHVGGLAFDVDVVLRDRIGGQPLVVLDTKYKDHDTPKPDDVQQVVFYAEVLRCREAWLVYPRPVQPLAFAAGDVIVRTFGVDLAKLDRLEASAEALRLSVPS